MRYVNGKGVVKGEMKNMSVDSEAILRIIKTVNERVCGDFCEAALEEKGS